MRADGRRLQPLSPRFRAACHCGEVDDHRIGVRFMFPAPQSSLTQSLKIEYHLPVSCKLGTVPAKVIFTDGYEVSTLFSHDESPGVIEW